MKTKKYILILLLITFIIPSITSASWWNPLSWSKNPKQSIDVVESNSVQLTDESVSIPETKPKEVIKPKVVEKIVEKPIVKTITVQDPALQIKINTLITENESLKAQVIKLLESNKSLNSELLSCEDKPTSTFSADDQCDYAKESLASFNRQIQEITLERSKELERIKTNPTEAESKYRDIYNRSGLASMIGSFKAGTSYELKPLVKGRDSAQSAIALYCN
ncbi:TPA: hypothetical protein DCX66_03640 [Candidatus Nomurabacteria bacterium]|uniref:Uncharacterized protein n=1 Tax=Candidatus Nomurabacteria bacterium GW2011_GWE1_35_16 TaxID=1618761 RepID=A0A0G0BT59_9BACT|nr:MAG: hypothetical protein UR55_C0001G0020 [Candidatus Nomurabacteria bacterium GW2011_GWF1_34_20]KKP63729.1 MAG: hypothetical protein UR57_C0001G0020 [Candidatus Nomurabacteria bacterium GW2011_GWE2_34_25]KKP66941.1 MAG: hypothetical protein UR64_C0001G0020 [Candidatus Nomurabacteria bacterium GW2011_GWE1_35_16]HAE36765.1 hypothetical protein [Candidatus Nomurabacteria bacterium]HAX65532.1 hypothetical protein [Candidatus Nomurabacteria bacterium]